jgi:hypothetical protein
MPFVTGLSDADFVGEDPQGDWVVDLVQLKEVIVKLFDDAVWRELGKVVAVDIFNGNNDRFDSGTGEWINRGNIMFLAGGQTTVIGLDTFDPDRMGAGRSNLNSAGGFDELNILIDANRRRVFAERCMKSVGEKMKSRLEGRLVGPKRNNVRVGDIPCFWVKTVGPQGPANVKIETKDLKDFFLPHAPVFAQGISDGADQLRTYIQGKVQQYAGFQGAQHQAGPRAQNAPQIGRGRAPQGGWRHGAVPQQPVAVAPRKQLPQGITDRAAYLGW